MNRRIGWDDSWRGRDVCGRNCFVEAKQNAARADSDVAIPVVGDFNGVIASSRKSRIDRCHPGDVSLEISRLEAGISSRIGAAVELRG